MQRIYDLKHAHSENKEKSLIDKTTHNIIDELIDITISQELLTQNLLRKNEDLRSRVNDMDYWDDD